MPQFLHTSPPPPLSTHASHSAEGHEFIVERKCACVSKTIDAMLAGASRFGSCTRPLSACCPHSRSPTPHD